MNNTNPLDNIDIDALEAQQQNDQANAAAHSGIAAGVGSEPDRHAEVLRLSEQSQLPPDVVARNIDQVRKKLAMDSLDIDGVINETPEAKSWLANPDNSKIISDDFTVVGKLKKTFTDIGRGFSSSVDTQELIDLRNKDMGEGLTPEEEARANAISASLDNTHLGTGDWWSTGPTLLAQNSVQMGRTFGYGGAGAAAGAGVGAGAALIAGQVPPLTLLPEELVTIPVFASRGAWLGWGAGAGYENYKQQSALTFNDLLKIRDADGKPLDRDLMRGAATVVGYANAGLDVFGLGKLAETIPGADQLKAQLTRKGIKNVLQNEGMKAALIKIGKKFATGVTAEGLTEGLQQVNQIAGEEIAKSLADGNFEHRTFGQAAAEVGQAAYQGALAAGTLAGITSTAAIPYELRRTRNFTPDQVMQHVGDINAAVRESTLYQRSPTRFHELVNNLAPDERFYVNGEMAQKVIGAMPEEQRSALFNAVPDLKTEMETAVINGGDVAIRKADYAAFIAPMEQANILAEHIKLDPADMSVAERNEFQQFAQANPELAQTMMAEVGGKPPAAPQETYAAIERIVSKAMQAAGRSVQEAKAVAPLFARTLSRFATPFGMNAVEFLNRGLLQFESVDAQGQPIANKQGAPAVGSNIGVLLDDLAAVREGKNLPSMDDVQRQAVFSFGEKLDAAGISPEQARAMDGTQLLAQLYPPADPNAMQLPEVELQQGPDGNLNINLAQPEPDTSGETLMQKYFTPPPEPQQQEVTDRPPQEPYNGTESAEFKEWFGDSKVVDENGKPLIVYHGTGSEIIDFKYEFTNQGNDQLGSGFYFTTDPSEASGYANSTYINGHKPASDKLPAKSTPNVVPVYLSIQNPVDVNAVGDISPEQVEQFISRAPDGGEGGLSNWAEDRGEALAAALPSYAIQGDNILKALHLIANDFYGDDIEGFNGAVRDILGFDGVVAGEIDGRKHFVAWFPTQIKSIFNSGKFSAVDPNILAQGERGSITFGGGDVEQKLQKVIIKFTERANYSTAAHEFSHYGVALHRYFAQLAQAQIAGGSEVAELHRIVDDWNELKKQVGANEDKFTVEQEEKISGWFEQYMRNGEAPSELLRRVFTRFRDWLMQIYKDITALGTPINDEVKGVFDRWLASEDEIAQVQNKNTALAEIATNLGLPPDIALKVSDYVNSATMHAEEKLYRELDQEQKRRETQAYKDEFAKVRKEVAAEFVNIREYNLIEYLKTQGFKILEGPETLGIDESILSSNEKSDSVLHPDMVADLYGYDSGIAMLRALKNTPGFDNAVDIETRKRLMTKYPDMISSGRIHNEAVPAIINDRVLLALDLMIKELGRSVGGANRAGMKQFAKVMAQTQVSKMKLSEVGYMFRYDVAREKSMREALKASREGKPDVALFHLQRALVNQTIYKSLQEFADMQEKAAKLFKRVNEKDKDLAKSTDIDFVGAARAILYNFGLGGENFNLAAWLQEVQERDPDIMNDLVAAAQMVTAQPKPAKELTTAEFRDVYNAVQNIMQTARQMKEFQIGEKKIKTEAALGELISKINLVDPTKPIEGTQVYGRQKFNNVLVGLKGMARRVEHWVNSMDGQFSGPFRAYVWKPISDAANNYRDARTHWMKGLNEILKTHKEYLQQPGKISVPELIKHLGGDNIPMVFRDRLELIGFLLHTGNQSNLDKLLGGYGIDPQNFSNAMLAMINDGRITKLDFQIVQTLWDYAEAIKPLSQKAHKQLYGYRFEEVEVTPIAFDFPMKKQTPGGGTTTVEERSLFRGGYWPAIIDTEQVDSNNVQRAVQDQKQYFLASTNKGFTKARVQNYQKPLSTDLRLASQHIDQVLRFAYLEPAVRQVARLLNNQNFKDELKRIDSQALNSMLMPWLQRTAQQLTSRPSQPGFENRFINKTFTFLRNSASAQAMMGNVLNALQNITGFSISAYKVGKRNFAQQLIRYMLNPLESNKYVREMSTMMRVRQNLDDMDISNEITNIVQRKGAYAEVKHLALRHGYIFQRLMQNFVDNVTWMAAYEQYIAKDKTESEAVEYADSIIRTTQGSGAPEDISSLEAGSPGAKLFTMFYGYFNNQSNLITTEARTIMREKGWNGSPELFYLYLMTVAVPAFSAELIVKATKDDLPKDDDDDGTVIDDWLKWFGGSQFRYVTAQVPYIGNIINQLVTKTSRKQPDDRITISPFSTSLETTGRFITKQFTGGYTNTPQEVRDFFNTVGFITGLPLGQLGKPASYVVAVKEGKAKPDNIFDFGRGLIVGPPPKK